MISATQIKKGMAIKLDDELYRVFSYQHLTPGKGHGFVQAKLRSLKSGAIIDHRFRSEDRVEQAYLEYHEVEFLYSDGNDYYFMNTETFDQFHLPANLLEDAIPYLIPNIKLQVEFFEEQAIGVTLPTSVELRVASTEPALRGATVSNVNKPATLETGAVVRVPLFLQIGDLIKVDTRTGEYQGRAKE